MSEPIAILTGPSPVIQLSGRWTIENLENLQKRATAVVSWQGRAITLDGSAIEQMDTNGAWLLHQIVSTARAQGKSIELVGLAQKVADLLALVGKRMERLGKVAAPAKQNLLEVIGRAVWAQTKDLLDCSPS